MDVQKNTQKNNSNYGININIENSSYNLIYHNSIIDNTNQYNGLSSSNTCDNYAGGDDYWVDYGGLDDVSNGRTAGDGIGNTEIPFNASLSSDLDSDELQYRWDFENDGICDTSYSTDSTATYAWYDDYSGLVMVEVYDGEQTNTETATVTVNNIVLHFILKTLFG